MTGLIVNKDLAPDIHSINDLFDPKYHGKVEMITELPEVVPLVMMAEGKDPLRASKQDWLDAIAKIKKAADDGQIRRFTGGDYARDLASGDAVAVIGWAADAFQLQADNPSLSWVMPTQGCILWWDNWVVPVGAPNPTAAYDWINYTYAPDHQAQIDAWTGAVTPVTGVKQVLQRTDSGDGAQRARLPEQAVHAQLLAAALAAGNRRRRGGRPEGLVRGDRRLRSGKFLGHTLAGQAKRGDLHCRLSRARRPGSRQRRERAMSCRLADLGGHRAD